MSYLISFLGGIWPKATENKRNKQERQQWGVVRVSSPLEGVVFYVLVATNKPKV